MSLALVPLILAVLCRPAAAQIFTGFGDSITYGIQSSWREGYLSVLRYYNSWELSGAPVKNEGLPDETSSEGLLRIGSAISQTGATHILIMEGTNDVNAGVSAQTVIANLQQMASVAVAAGVVPVVGSPPPRKSSDTRDPGNAKAIQISQSMRAFALANGYPFASVFDDFMAQSNPDGFFADRVHPNDWGYVLMSHSWHDAIRTIYPGPVISSVSPDWGDSANATPITLSGSGFVSGMQGYLFSMVDPASKVYPLSQVSIASGSSATATTQASLPAFLYDVVLTSNGTTGAVLYDGFSATQTTPTIASLTPNNVPAGTTSQILINGSGYQRNVSVYFGGKAGTSAYFANTANVYIDNPVLGAGGYDVRLVNPDRSEVTVSQAFFSLGTPPTLTTVSPPSGSNSFSQSIVLTGTGFLPGAGVLLGTTALSSVTVTSATTIDAVVPAGFPEGIYDVTVRNPDSQTATLAAAYTAQGPPPVVTSVTPSTIEAGSRVTLTIDGQNFQAGDRVFADVTELYGVVIVSSGQVTAVTPMDLPIGIHDVIVTAPLGTQGSLPAGLTVQDTTAPSLVTGFPADGAVGAPTLPLMNFWLADAGAGVDMATISLEIDGVPVTGVTATLGPKVVHVSYLPAAAFSAKQLVAVRLVASDLVTPPSTLDRTMTFRVTDGVDGDGDGLPSDWEASEGLDSQKTSGRDGAAGDPDRDDSRNQAEFAAGSDPTTPAFLAAAPGPGPSNPSETAFYAPSGDRFDAKLSLPYGGYGLNIGLADLEGASASALLTGPGPHENFGPQARAFRNDLSPISKVNFYAYGTLRFGVKVAGGRVETMGSEAILTGPGPGDVFGPQVRAFRYNGNFSPIAKVNFFAYGTLKYGVNPGSGYLDADGFAEILTAAPPGPVFGPHVRGFNFDGGKVQSMGKVSFFAYGTPRYGVNATAGDLDRDGFDEILTGPGPSQSFAPQVRGFEFDDVKVIPIPSINFLAFSGAGRFGANVASGDLDGDGASDLVVGKGDDPAEPAEVRTFFWNGAVTGGVDFFAFDDTTYGANVASRDLGLAP